MSGRQYATVTPSLTAEQQLELRTREAVRAIQGRLATVRIPATELADERRLDGRHRTIDLHQRTPGGRLASAGEQDQRGITVAPASVAGKRATVEPVVATAPARAAIVAEALTQVGEQDAARTVRQAADHARTTGSATTYRDAENQAMERLAEAKRRALRREHVAQQLIASAPPGLRFAIERDDDGLTLRSRGRNAKLDIVVRETSTGETAVIGVAHGREVVRRTVDGTTETVCPELEELFAPLLRTAAERFGLRHDELRSIDRTPPAPGTQSTTAARRSTAGGGR